MAVTLRTLTVHTLNLLDAATPGAKITLRLNQYDLDADGVVMPVQSVEATADADGIATVQLWPNALGVRDTRYLVTIRTADGSKALLRSRFYMPDTDSSLESLLTLGTVGLGQQALFINAVNDLLAPLATDDDLTAESTARQAADTALQNNIDAEATARTDADANLQAQVDTKLDAADYVPHYKGKFVSLAALAAAIPAGTDGDYAIVNSGAGVDAQEAIWDAEEGWVLSAGAAPATTDEVAEGATNLYFTTQRVRGVVLTGLSLVTNAAITAADTVLTALGKLQAQVNDLLTRVGALEAGGGGGGGGTISADTAISYPGAYANWAALIADLKSNVYTGTVTVNVAAGTYTEAFDFGTDLNMPNLNVVFDAATQVDTTGWAPNFFIYICGIKGVNSSVGSISGTLTRVGDATPVFAMAGVNFRVGYGTSDGLLPVSGGTMTDMAFVNFERGVSMVRSELVGYGKLVMTGLRTGQGEGFNAFGSMIRGVELELDGDVVNVGGAYSGSIADGGPFGTFRKITFTGTVGATRHIVAKDGMVDLGTISNTGTDAWSVISEFGAEAIVRITANSTFSPHNGGNVLGTTNGGKITSILLGDVTWTPYSINSRFSGGDGQIDIANYSGASTITVDNSGGVTPDFVFGQQYGSVQNISTAGSYGFVHQFGANKISESSMVWNSQVSSTQVSNAITGSTIKVDPSASTLYHQDVALTDTLTIDLTYLAADQEFTLLSYNGVTNLAFTEVVTNAPAGLTANVPIRLKKMSGNWYAV